MAEPRKRGQQPANRIFVDREAPRRVIENAAFAIPADRSIIRVFYGVGGQGKTALCREIMRITSTHVDPAYAFLRRAELDLHKRTKDDPDRLLVWIRNGLANDGIAFPCFDLAFALAWEATRGEEPMPLFSKPWLTRTTGQYGVEGAADLASGVTSDLIGSIPGVGFMLKKLGRWSIEKGKRYYLEKTKEALAELYDGAELKKPYQLSEVLPWMLAQDINAHIEANPDQRVMLLVDEYERVGDQGGAGVKWRDNPFDAHMRRLISETNGMLVVFFSREKLSWELEDNWRDDLAGNQHLLGGLADQDADVFLRGVPIEDEVVRAAMIDGARETAAPRAPVYPLMLDLQVEQWNALRQKGLKASPDLFAIDAESFSARRNEIVHRVLRDYDAPLQVTLERLSVARRFDRAAFAHVVKAFGTALPLDQFDRIASLSFVTTVEDGYLSIHNLVAETIRETLADDLRASSIEALLDHFLGRLRTDSPAEVTRAHLLAAIEAAWLRLSKGSIGYVPWLSETLADIERSALARETIPLWREAVEIATLQLGEAHADTATALAGLAKRVWSTGDSRSARPMMERALAIREGKQDDKNTAISLSDLAALHQTQGDYPAARALFERSLALQVRMHGNESPEVATGLNNLASLLHDMGEYAAARPIYERSLAISRHTLGETHPETAATINNLALLLRTMGNFADAKSLYEKALAIDEKTLGPEHPDTASNLNNLAALYQAIGDLKHARPLFERSLAIREKVLGPNHPETAASLNSFAALLEEQGDRTAARLHFERALAIREEVLGPDHPHTGTVLNNLALLLRSLGEHATARPLFERAIRISETALGSAHTTTAIANNNLALLLKDLGEHDLALAHMQRALASVERALGDAHPTTNRLRGNLAKILHAAGRSASALALAQSAFEQHRQALGEDHAWTKQSAETLADIRTALA